VFGNVPLLVAVVFMIAFGEVPMNTKKQELVGRPGKNNWNYQKYEY
jgi:hypothetical protein